MSTRPRTPEHFPKMRHRARHRRMRSQQRAKVGTALISITVETRPIPKRLREAFRKAGDAFGNVGRAATAAGESIRQLATDPVVPAHRAQFSEDPAKYSLASLPALRAEFAGRAPLTGRLY